MGLDTEVVTRPRRQRSLRRDLSLSVGDPISIIGPKGVDAGLLRALTIVVGPFTASVLCAYREFGGPARNDELGEVLRRIDGEPKIPRTYAMWRMIAIAAAAAEDLAAMLASVRRWSDQGRPRGDACSIGSDFLTWPDWETSSAPEVLRTCAVPSVIQQLLSYPSAADLARYVDPPDADMLAVLATRSATRFAAFLSDMCEVLTPDVARTFARWKHRLSATSPGVAPIWTRRVGRNAKAALDDRLGTGFGVLDWHRGRPYLLVWPADKTDIAIYANVAVKSVQLTQFVADSVLRWALPSIPALPLIGMPRDETTDSESLALLHLEQSHYRTLGPSTWSWRSTDELHPK